MSTETNEECRNMIADESVNVTAKLTDTDGLNISWSLAKDNGKAQSINSLTNDGGTLTFDEKGIYTLYYSVTDDTGRVFDGSTDITVYPVTSIKFTMSEYTHTDKTADISADFYGANNDVTWYVDGKVNTELDTSGRQWAFIP